LTVVDANSVTGRDDEPIRTLGGALTVRGR
jgi:hypothetical protein